MMDFIFVPLVVGVITLGIYKFFELLVCRRERRMIIDKMDGNALIDYLKFVPMGVRIGAPVSVRPVSGGALRNIRSKSSRWPGTTRDIPIRIRRRLQRRQPTNRSS